MEIENCELKIRELPPGVGTPKELAISNSQFPIPNSLARRHAPPAFDKASGYRPHANSLAGDRSQSYGWAMSYLTVAVEIDHGHVLPKGSESLPEKASGLLTILELSPLSQPRPVGLAKGQFTVPEDFNAPLPEDVLQSFEGK